LVLVPLIKFRLAGHDVPHFSVNRGFDIAIDAIGSGNVGHDSVVMAIELQDLIHQEDIHRRKQQDHGKKGQ
jgi:hypothetical protein